MLSERSSARIEGSVSDFSRRRSCTHYQTRFFLTLTFSFMEADQLNKLSKEIIGAAVEVHRYFGPGLLENTYRDALVLELGLRNIEARKEVVVPCLYKGFKLDLGFRADVVVRDSIVVELKATQEDNPVFAKQLFTYLKVMDKRLGLLINFNKSRLIDGVTRVVNRFQE